MASGPERHLNDWFRYLLIGLAIVWFIVILGVAITSNQDDEPKGLDGTSWNLDEIVGTGAPIGGAPIDVAFESDRLAGVSGCNNYSGEYQVEGLGFRAGPFAVTQMFCEQPAGTMDQEAQYLGLLESADNFIIDDGRLVLQRSDERLLVFRPA